jgi:pentatricopeptide repeat protein
MSSKHAWDRLAKKAAVAAANSSKSAQSISPSPRLSSTRYSHLPSLASGNDTLRPWTSITPQSNPTLADFFVNALVRAGTCKKHVHQLSHASPRFRRTPIQARALNSSAIAQPPSSPPPADADPHIPDPGTWNISKRLLKTLVDIYEDADFEEKDRAIWMGGSGLSGRIEQDHSQYLTMHQYDLKKKKKKKRSKSRSTTKNPVGTLNAQEGEDPNRTELDAAMVELMGYVRDPKIPLRQIHNAFLKLPSPRIMRFGKEDRRKLLERLCSREESRRDVKKMMLFLSVIDEMKAYNLQMPPAVWNTALHYATNELDWITPEDAQTVIRLWKEMEVDYQVEGGQITLTVLYVAAAKAGLYALADRIWRLFDVRGFEHDRVVRTAQIFAYGLRQDGHRVRASYLKFVEDGFIIDSYVLSIVVSALIQAKEVSAAEEVFRRMKDVRDGPMARLAPPATWSETKKLQRILKKAENKPEVTKRMSAICPVAPIPLTYRSLIKHYSFEGDYDRCYQLVLEMIDSGFRLDYSFFDILFRGFAYHGGLPFSGWTATRLESLWAAFVKTVDNDPQFSYNHDDALARVTMRAFARCFSQERGLEKYEWFVKVWINWEPSEKTQSNVGRYLVPSSASEQLGKPQVSD